MVPTLLLAKTNQQPNRLFSFATTKKIPVPRFFLQGKSAASLLFGDAIPARADATAVTPTGTSTIIMD